MVDSDIKPWLPEYYREFAQASAALDKHYLLRGSVLGSSVLAFGTGIIMQRPAIIGGALIVGGLTYLLLDPQSPVNIPGRRLYEQQKQSALDIAQHEGWFEEEYSYGEIIRQVRVTVTLTGELAPRNPLQTPEEMIKSFNERLKVEGAYFGPEGFNTVRTFTRKALNFGERYWESQDTDYAKRMVEAIKIRRSALSQEAHISFQSGNIP